MQSLQTLLVTFFVALLWVSQRKLRRAQKELRQCGQEIDVYMRQRDEARELYFMELVRNTARKELADSVEIIKANDL